MELNKSRKLTVQEEMLLEYLINISNHIVQENWKEKIRVKPLNDGNMGSLELFVNNDSESSRIFGRQVAECYFFDTDGVKVIASLNVDSGGNLYELDVWKTDFSPLIEIPSNVDFIYKSASTDL